MDEKSANKAGIRKIKKSVTSDKSVKSTNTAKTSSRASTAGAKASKKAVSSLPAKTLVGKTLATKTLVGKTLGAKIPAKIPAKTLPAKTLVGKTLGAKIPAKTLPSKTLGAKIPAKTLVGKTLGASTLVSKRQESKRPESKRPENKRPESKRPESKRPETRTPQASRQENKRPESKRPETRTPQVSRPENKRPETRTPQVSRPENKRPETRTTRSLASSVFSKLGSGSSSGSGYWQGQMLLASPAIGDTRFERSIVYLCHQGKDGALGLVVNKVAEKIQFTDVLDHLSIPFSSDFESISVHVGGPVESSRGFVLHSPEKKFSGTIELGELAMTASADILKHIALGKGPKDYVFLLGYAGWGTGQLDKEIASNAWLHLPFNSDLIFGGDNKDKWSRAMEQLGILPHLLSGISGNA